MTTLAINFSISKWDSISAWNIYESVEATILEASYTLYNYSYTTVTIDVKFWTSLNGMTDYSQNF